MFVTAGGGAPQGGQSPHYGRFLSQVSMTKKLEPNEVAKDDNQHEIPIAARSRRE